jgi:hypothetical protein
MSRDPQKDNTDLKVSARRQMDLVFLKLILSLALYKNPICETRLRKEKDGVRS